MWCLLLLYVRIPIQQILHVLLTLCYKFVNDLVNWFLLPWLWRHRAIYLTGRSSQIYRHFHGWVRATLYRETLVNAKCPDITWKSMIVSQNWLNKTFKDDNIFPWILLCRIRVLRINQLISCSNPKTHFYSCHFLTWTCTSQVLPSITVTICCLQTITWRDFVSKRYFCVFWLCYI